MIAIIVCHRGRHAQRFVNAYQIVVGEVQGDGSSMVRPLL
jgi:hypothetical protein